MWKFLGKYLQKLGDEVESAENGEAAKTGRAGEKCGDEARRSGRHSAAVNECGD
jgi:hypothetical protein